MLVSRPILALLGVSICLAAGCEKAGGGKTAGPTSRPAAPVRAAVAVVQDVPIQIRSIAKVEPFSNVTIRSRVSGELIKAHLAAGQNVKAGDLLFEIDPRPYENALLEAQATLERDKALASNMKIEADRMHGLLANNVATREEADKAHFNEEAAQATVRRGEATLQNARLQLAYTKIVAPIDARAGELLAYPGNIIKSDDTDLLVLNQIRPIYVTFNVPEQDLDRIKERLATSSPGVDVSIPPANNITEQGQLSFVDNQVDNSTGTIRLKGTFPNTNGKLWPGQFVQATLNLRIEADAVLIPTRAVQAGQNGNFVFVIRDDSTVEIRTVTLGRVVEDKTVIETGVRAGERIVTEGHLRLGPGSSVSINDSPETPSNNASNSSATETPTTGSSVSTVNAGASAESVHP